MRAQADWVRWLGRNRTSEGSIGMRGCTTSLVTSHADLAISFISQGQYQSARGARCTGRLSLSATFIRCRSQTTAIADPIPAPSRNGVKNPDSTIQKANRMKYRNDGAQQIAPPP